MAKAAIKCSANCVPLSPISFLERSAVVYSDRISVVYGDLKFTWKQTHDRCRRLASALSRRGISRGDAVAALAPNTPAMYELHFAVPMAGAVLSTLNILNDSAMVSVLLIHSEAKIIFVDHQFLDVAKGAFKILSEKGIRSPSLILIPEPHDSVTRAKIETSVPEFVEYESLVAAGENEFAVIRPNDERDPIALNFTSGTVSSPNGFVYSHREAYLNSMAAVLINEMQSVPVYLWTVPMFHCNGWCLTWGVAAQGGTNICLRNVTAKVIFDSIATYNVTHMGGAPAVLNMIMNAAPSEKRPISGKVKVMTGAAPPPPQVLSEMEELGFDITHEHGMVEAYVPGTVRVGSQRGAKNVWRVKEDVVLMSSWCLASEDKMRAKIPKGASLWARVHYLFHEARAKNPEEIGERNVESMKGRWKRLNENGRKWVVACKEAYGRRKSGMSEKDVEKEAHAIYEAYGSKFQDLFVFNEVMSKHRKWELKFDHDSTRLHPENEEGDEERLHPENEEGNEERLHPEKEEGNEESGDSSKRSRNNEDGEYSISSTPETPSSGCSTIPHPTGRDKAKNKRKGKASQSSSNNEVAAKIRALRLAIDNRIQVLSELGSSRIDLELKKEQRKTMKMKHILLNTLLAKDHLSPEDEEIKRRLIEIVFTQLL